MLKLLYLKALGLASSWSVLYCMQAVAVAATSLPPGRRDYLAMVLEDGQLAEVEKLDLQDNKISGQGFQALARAFSRGALPKLHELFLNGNIFDEDSKAAMIDAMATKPTVDLDIC